ncbi:polymer-forming cytoskeletal protein [uncultured Sanguibacteroides sp.]|uniref:bactofilin family protein n=1 Tax=uncultured Sanguibacteroides sp. TaxID=1635151 RepID=UPI0025F5B72E|nr:polymer-forming cytoskeletal protein [uncultured Sanguibacteroides sp.]
MAKNVHQHNAKRTVILSTSVIQGDIRVPNDLFLEGVVAGNVDCGGVLTVKRGAVVEGDVNCKVLDADGWVKGSVNTKDLTMREEGRIEGRVETGRLRIVGDKIGINELCLVKNII